MISISTQKNQLNESIGGLAAAGGLALAVGALFQAISSHREAVKLESTLIANHDDDYLKLKLDSNVSINSIIKKFTLRGKLTDRLVSRGDIVLINNMETARLLKQHLSNYPIFKHLFENKQLKYKSGDDFFRDHKELFEIFGQFRSKSGITWDGAIKAFFSLGLSKTVSKDAVPPKVEANLYYLALFFRQLAIHKDEINDMEFGFEKIQVRHNR